MKFGSACVRRVQLLCFHTSTEPTTKYWLSSTVGRRPTVELCDNGSTGLLAKLDRLPRLRHPSNGDDKPVKAYDLKATPSCSPLSTWYRLQAYSAIMRILSARHHHLRSVIEKPLFLCSSRANSTAFVGDSRLDARRMLFYNFR